LIDTLEGKNIADEQVIHLVILFKFWIFLHDLHNIDERTPTPSPQMHLNVKNSRRTYQVVTTYAGESQFKTSIRQDISSTYRI